MKTFKSLLLAATITAATFASSANAANIVYQGSDTQSGVAIDYSITTNGALGVLSLADIVGSSITFTGSAASRYGAFGSFTALNSVYFSNTNDGGVSPVSATANALSFDFGNGGGLNFDFQTFTDADGTQQSVAYALAARGINDGDAVVYDHGDLATRELDDPQDGFRLTAGTYTATTPTVQVFATADAPGAVPEPASWAMMIVGMGGIGAAMRRRKSKVTTTVAFA